MRKLAFAIVLLFLLPALASASEDYLYTITNNSAIVKQVSFNGTTQTIPAGATITIHSPVPLAINDNLQLSGNSTAVVALDGSSNTGGNSTNPATADNQLTANNTLSSLLSGQNTSNSSLSNLAGAAATTNSNLSSLISGQSAANSNLNSANTNLSNLLSGQSTTNSDLSSLISGQNSTNTSLAALLAHSPTLGQKTAANSMPVVLATDQTAIPVNAIQSGAWSVSLLNLPVLPAGNNNIGSVSVANFPTSQPVTNTGTFAVQNTAAIIGGNTTAVKIDGSAVTQPVSASSLPLPTGAAQENGNLATLVARTPVLGANTRANAQPVTLASDQPTISVNDSNNNSYTTSNPITVGGSSVAAGRAWDAVCTVGGLVTATLNNGSSKQFPVSGGTSAAPSLPTYTVMPFAITAITASTATCSAYANIN